MWHSEASLWHGTARPPHPPEPTANALPPRYCPEGTYMNDTYLWDTPCFDCQPCPAGLYRVGCTGASAGTCIACADHLRKTDEGSWGSIEP